MTTASSSNTTEIAQFAGALYDVALDNAAMQSVLTSVNTQGLDPFLNAFYSAHLASLSTATVAQAMADNLGLTGSALTAAETFITDQLNAAAPDSRGATVAAVLDAFAGLTGNAVFGPAAQAWDTLVGDAVSYSQSSASVSNVALSALPGLSLSPPYTLTTGIDHIVATTNNAVIDGFGQGLGTANSGVAPTFTSGDTISGGTTTGATFNLTDTETGGVWNPTAVSQASVSNIPTVNLYSGEVVVFAPTNSAMGYTGLTDVNLTSVSGAYHFDEVVVGPNTAVTVNDQAGAGLGAAPYGAYGMVVQGGSRVTVTEANGSGYGNAQHAILISGGPGTTQVSVTQIEDQPKGYQQGVTIDDNNGTIRTIAVSGLDNSSWTSVVNYGPSVGYGGYGYGGYAVKQFNGGDLKINHATALTQLTLGNMVNGAYATVSGATALTSLSVDNVTGNAYINLYNEFAPSMALSLSLQGISGAVDLFDEASVYTTLNVSVAGNAALNYTVSSLLASDNLQTLTVSGTGVLTFSQSLQTPANLTQVTVQGAAGLYADLSAAGSGHTVINASGSSGAVTLWLDGAQQQVFMGGAGTTVVNLDGNATEAITAGSGTSNEVVLNFALGGSPLTAQTEALVTGFDVLGVTSALGSGNLAVNVAAFAGDPIHTLDVQGGAASGSLTFSGVAAGGTLQVDAGDPQALVVQTSDLQGPSDSFNVTLGQSGASGNATTTALTLEDGLLQGLGRVTLNAPGTAGSTQTVSQFTDLALGALTLSGSQTVLVSTLTDHATALTVTDLTPGSTVSALADPNLATLTLSGNLALTLTGDAVSSGVSINGSADNGPVTISLASGAAANATDQIALGNGSNQVTDPSASGHVSLTLGSGSNQVTLTSSGVQGSVTFAAHTGAVDQLSVGAVGYNGNQAQVLVTGFVPGGDQIHFLADPQAGSAVIALTQATAQAYASAQGLDITQLATWIDSALATNGLNLATHAVATFQLGGNTYLVEQGGATGSAFTSGDTLVGFTGLLTFTHL